MRLTKYKHACAVLELDGQSLVIDPGEFSYDFVVPDNIAAVVLTHQHPDHTSLEKLSDIVRRYPDVQIFTTADNSITLSHHVVSTGDTRTIGPFTIKFFGGEHAQIDSAIPCIENIGFIVNDVLCYPGDSFARPDQSVDILLLPVAAPWMKISEALDYVRVIKPRVVIPTHDAILSEAGQGIVDKLVDNLTTELSLTYSRIPATKSIDIP